ncbi:hypothetical protein ACHAWO_005028 [Cyclotella atomus]|uniref:DDE Tnp4 domain-containing protein n=1 Tax=Cyclotella atomus TaxID=382360 RepID=A0ABD3PA89_9STRA
MRLRHDVVAFESSDLKRRLDQGLLAPNLVLFGDNAYINSQYMVTPYPNTSGGPKDNYNFFHSQLRIRIECAFGMLVQRWGILRSAMPRNISIGKTITLVLALAKLHNFCIDADDEVVANPLLQDEQYLSTNASGSVPLVPNADASELLDREVTTPEDLIGGGEHFDDAPRQFRRRQQDDYHRTRLCIHVQDTFMTRPRMRGT